MHIYLFGNLNSGKSTLSQKLSQFLPSYSYLLLDEFRILYSDGSAQGEQQACERFVAAVSQTSDAIIEFSGYGRVAELLKLQLKTKRGILIHCVRDIEKSISAINADKYAKIPYPVSYKKAQSIAETIQFLADKVTLKTLEYDWQCQIWQSYSFEYGQDFSKFWQLFPLRHHQCLDKLRHAFVDDVDAETVLGFGSLGANRLTTLSDLDLFIQSDLSADKWCEKLLALLGNECVHADILGTKITLRMKNRLLVEVVIGRTTSEISLYYRESQIHNVNFTVLKGTTVQVKELKAITQQKSDNKAKASELASQVYFLFCSLPTLMVKDDGYKYSFHCSIMQHYCVQLEHILMGKHQHNYLPKFAVNTLEDFPWQAFSTSPTVIKKSQYDDLFQYLMTLFSSLQQQELIDNKHYFSKETLFLHQISTDL
ncbi:hypothetical protein C0Z01_20305 [Photobacterium kishitanii]|uniref:hypothetical protein n=1 Tax=Photobacterium kishitanii TaxID=318456 RepID=UPI000D16A18A|nr:hypothetical protein [Photobacterium kishitanii]PSW66561.1 hypothetical protein C0Z01_20305 [Photobacterium kishitanii]